MLSPDLQRIKHIRDYCVEVEGRLLVTETPLTSLIMTPTISALFRSAFCRLVNSAVGCLRSTASQPPNMFSGDPSKECGIWLPTTTEAWAGTSSGKPPALIFRLKKTSARSSFPLLNRDRSLTAKAAGKQHNQDNPLNADSRVAYYPPYIVETKYSPSYWDGIHGNHTLLWYSGSLYPYRRLRQLAFKKWCKNAPESIALQWIPGLYLFDSPWDAKNT